MKKHDKLTQDKKKLKQFIIDYNNKNLITKEIYDKYEEYFNSVIEMNNYYDNIIRNIIEESYKK